MRELACVPPGLLYANVARKAAAEKGVVGKAQLRVELDRRGPFYGKALLQRCQKVSALVDHVVHFRRLQESVCDVGGGEGRQGVSRAASPLFFPPSSSLAMWPTHLHRPG